MPFIDAMMVDLVFGNKFARWKLTTARQTPAHWIIGQHINFQGYKMYDFTLKKRTVKSILCPITLSIQEALHL